MIRYRFILWSGSVTVGTKMLDLNGFEHCGDDDSILRLHEHLFVFRTATLYFYYRAIVVGCNLKLRLMAALKNNLLINIAKIMPVCKDKLEWRSRR